MRFTKMQGLGNDFLLVYDQLPEKASSLCAWLCDRHFGVGADGVIFLSPSPPCRLPHAHLQRRRQRGEDVRQRHPLRGEVSL